jgi:hypothetical protein
MVTEPNGEDNSPNLIIPKSLSGLKAIRTGYTPLKRKDSMDCDRKFNKLRVDLSDAHSKKLLERLEDKSLMYT